MLSFRESHQQVSLITDIPPFCDPFSLLLECQDSILCGLPDTRSLLLILNHSVLFLLLSGNSSCFRSVSLWEVAKTCVNLLVRRNAVIL